MGFAKDYWEAALLPDNQRTLLAQRAASTLTKLLGTKVFALTYLVVFSKWIPDYAVDLMSPSKIVLIRFLQFCSRLQLGSGASICIGIKGTVQISLCIASPVILKRSEFAKDYREAALLPDNQRKLLAPRAASRLTKLLGIKVFALTYLVVFSKWIPDYAVDLLSPSKIVLIRFLQFCSRLQLGSGVSISIGIKGTVQISLCIASPVILKRSEFAKDYRGAALLPDNLRTLLAPRAASRLTKLLGSKVFALTYLVVFSKWIS